MVKQEVYSRIWQHFVVDKNPISEKGGCPQYRGEDNNKCVIGILIPDNLYKAAMEGLNVETVLARWPMVRAHILGDLEYEAQWVMIQFLLFVQSIHDDAVWEGETHLFDGEYRFRLMEAGKDFDV